MTARRTYDPAVLSDRMPLEMPVQKTPWYSKIVSNTAWRVYITILLVLNLIATSAIIGSLQQVYKSVNTLTEFVAKSIMNPPKPHVPETPKSTQPAKPIKRAIPQSYEAPDSVPEVTPLPTPSTPTYEYDHDPKRNYYVLEDRRHKRIS